MTKLFSDLYQHSGSTNSQVHHLEMEMDQLLNEVSKSMMKTKDTIAAMLKHRHGSLEIEMENVRKESVQWKLLKDPAPWEVEDKYRRKGWYKDCNDLPARRRFDQTRKANELKKWYNSSSWQTKLAENNRFKLEIMEPTRFVYRKFLPVVEIYDKCAHCGARKCVCLQEITCYYRFIHVANKKVSFCFDCGTRCDKKRCGFKWNETNHLCLCPNDFWNHCMKYGWEYFMALAKYWKDMHNEYISILKEDIVGKNNELNDYGLAQKKQNIQKLCDVMKQKCDLKSTIESDVMNGFCDMDNIMRCMRRNLIQMNDIYHNQSNFLPRIKTYINWLEDEIDIAEKEFLVLFGAERCFFRMDSLCASNGERI